MMRDFAEHPLQNRAFISLGAAGALLLFVGDMLFYGHWGAGEAARTGLIHC